MESQHVKSINLDKRSKKRIKFASAKERSKRASADVYRSHKRKIGATSATTREDAVHNPHRQLKDRKRHRAHHLPVEDKNKSAVLRLSKEGEEIKETEEEELELEVSSSFASELDESLDRNASEIFAKFHRQIWPLVRSLPEILHHSSKIIDLMLSHLLSPASTPECPTLDLNSNDANKGERQEYIINHATAEILHLMAVLARDLRHEIHPFLHKKLLPRVINDLLNPPPPPPNSGKQPIPLDVTIIEASFRCISYILRYDTEEILQDMEAMRKYYGTTLASRRELTRRLAAETFAPLIRKIKSQSDRQRHLKRVIRALAATENQPINPSLKRTQDDAVDGIGQLVFQIVKGVPGKIHSQGQSTIQFVLSYCTRLSMKEKKSYGRDLLFAVASTFLDRLFRYIDDSGMAFLLMELSEILKKTISKELTNREGDPRPRLCALKLLSQTATYRSGSQLAQLSKSQILQLHECIQEMLSERHFWKLSPENREETMTLICSVWTCLETTSDFPLRLRHCLNEAFLFNEDMNGKHVASVRALAFVLTRELLPNLQEESSLKVLGSVILSLAKRLANVDKEATLLTLFAMATKNLDKTFISEEEQLKSSCLDSILFSSTGPDFSVPLTTKKVLLECCTITKEKSSLTRKSIEKMAVMLRCIPFVTLLQCEDETESDKQSSFKRATQWITEVLSNKDPEMDASVGTGDLIVLRALALESVAYLTSQFLDSEIKTTVAQKVLRRVLKSAEELLFSNPRSLWATRGVSALAQVLPKFGMHLHDNADEVFDLIAPNLSSSSHALRLHSLRILTSFQKKNFIVDHADIDFEGDLDEEPSFKPLGSENTRKGGPVGQCDIIETLLQIEKMRVRLTTERPLLSLVSRIEVLGRSGRLPVSYAEAAAHQMLGLFYVKFAPLWPVVSRALVALAKGQEDTVWPALEAKLVKVMEHVYVEEKGALDDTAAHLVHYGEHFSACLDWEKSMGRNVSIFGPEVMKVEEGEVPRHLTTDDPTVMESVWEVAEKCQQLVAKHSRVIVPCFLQFLTEQFYHFHSDDPSARELQFKVTDVATSIDRTLLNKYQLQKQLMCFLKTFAAIDGPQQLVKHKLLEQIFRSFLTHQETSIVRVSLSCLLKFKPKYLMPYDDLVKGILEKGGLRNALLKFQEAIEGGKIDKAHREMLIPVISRIVFGRLSVRESRSSKDTPAAKRAAILSFVSLLCQEDEELFSFLYLMTRGFVPRTGYVKEIELYSRSDQVGIMDTLSTVKPSNLKHLPGAVIEGFLHLLQTVISQLGHRIRSYIPRFTSIVVALSELYGVDREEALIDDEGRGDSEDADLRPRVREGAIRTLCFQRLSEMFTQFGQTVDFSDFGPALWHSVKGSISLLPEMVVKSEKAPALLHMLLALSSEASLIPMFALEESAISSVIKCIAGESLPAVMNIALSFVENLLDEFTKLENKDVSSLIMSQIPLLLKQFSVRFKVGEDAAVDGKDKRPRKFRMRLRSTTWRRELKILCRVSELMPTIPDLSDESSKSVLEELCGLLLPFLGPDQGTSDEDKLNVIGILKSSANSLETDTQQEMFETLSSVLAPVKAKPGIDSIVVRSEIARLMVVLSEKSISLKQVAQKVAKLTSVNQKRVDEIDFEIVIPELNRLCADKNCDWISLGVDNPTVLAPLIFICFHFLYNEDGVLARTSFNALKTLVGVASKECTENSAWTKLVESLVIPPTRAGLQARDASIRRFYILIIREIAKFFNGHSSANLCGDLSPLLDEDNPDLDFFIGITHVQIHRRARAFQRLRKQLNEKSNQCSFSSQSLHSVLLPLSLHPAYECKTKAEENFALEGIATVGAIARSLPWNKYSNTLSSILSSFDRHPEQERYLVGTMCAIIDSFNFDLLEISSKNNAGTSENLGDAEPLKSAVWRSLERRIIPKVEGLLTKEKKDKNGSRINVIRPTIVLALLKLFQKFPMDFFESRLPHILTVMCDALKSRDSDARDVARNTMAKIVTSMDLKYLADVVREVTITLNEGYKLHVRAAVIHTILYELSQIYKPSDEACSNTSVSSFDSCIPALMDVLQEDLFGVANERRESQETNVRYVKEAGGSKSINSIEMMCRMIAFMPSRAKNSPMSKSATHCIVSPLLERLRSPDVEANTIRKIKEILMRVAIGLSNNPSIQTKELLPFVYATVQPFIGSQLVNDSVDAEDAEEPEGTIRISGSKASKNAVQKPSKGKVAEWRPSSLNNPTSAKAAKDYQSRERKELRRVRDGANAPKLTGTARHGQLNISSVHGLNDPATINAVIFGLNLLHSFLKKTTLEKDPELIAMIDPFVPMLTACICHCRDNDVALVAMKCLMAFLKFSLPSLSKCSAALGTQALEFLSSSGSSLNQNHDMTQACFKTLTYLINLDQKKDNASQNVHVDHVEGEQALSTGARMPLNAEQMRVLISLLSVSIAESEQHNPALGLIKAILSRRFMSVEFYSLMESMLKLNVRSQKPSLRQQSGGIFIRYLLDYPMGEERFEKHLKQIVANISYEYQEGRLSAVQLLNSVIEKLPDDLLERHAQLIFLPLVLQLVNDDVKECREAVHQCLVEMLLRSSLEVLKSLYNYTVRWSQNNGPLRVASLQIFGIFVESCSNFIQSDRRGHDWIKRLHGLLEKPLASEEWEVHYFSLVCIEKLFTNTNKLLFGSHVDRGLWSSIVQRLVDAHPWIKLATSRIILGLFASSDSQLLITTLEATPGLLFEITRNLCFQLNLEEAMQSQELSELAIKTLTMALPLMQQKPELCFAEDSPHAGLRDPIAWLLRRLSQIAKPKGRQRRIGVFKCFAAFCSRHQGLVVPHMELLLEPLHRSDVEGRNELDNPAVLHRTRETVEPDPDDVMTEASLARDVLQLIEEACAESPEEFLRAYAVVKSRARDKKDQRKIQAKVEAVQDPLAAAQKKIKKQEREKQRRKRRVDERRRGRGAEKKRRSGF